MKRFEIGGCLVLVTLSGLAAGQPTQPKLVQWEYCVLEISLIGNPCSLSSSDDVVSGKGILELAEKLGVRNVANNRTPVRVIQVKLLNHLGTQGWELVAAASDGPARTTYHFKKRRP